jgi:putative RecB family exonuclease
VFGAALHRAIEFHFRELLAGNDAPSEELLLSHYQVEWRERASADIRYGKDETADSLAELACRMLAKFMASEAAKPTGTILAVEERLRGAIISGLPDLVGIVDLIVETADELQITDWKSSRARWSQDQLEDSAEQLALYAALASDFAPGKRIRTQFGVLVKTKDPVIERHSRVLTTQQVDRTKRVVERVWKAIEAEHFFPAPSPMACASCPYRAPCRLWPA